MAARGMGYDRRRVLQRRVTNLLRGWQVTINNAAVPIWISWIGLAIAAYLAYEGFRLAKK